MPTVGKEKFAYTSQGVAEAKQKSAETGIPVTNGANRVENYQFGGVVGQPGFGQRPVVKPPIGNVGAPLVTPPLGNIETPLVKPPLGNVGAPLGMYEEGGEVEYKKGGKIKK